MPKGQEFIPHGPKPGCRRSWVMRAQQAAGKAKGLPLSDTIFAGGPSHGGQADNTNYARPHLSRDQVDSTLGRSPFGIRAPQSEQSIARLAAPQIACLARSGPFALPAKASRSPAKRGCHGQPQGQGNPGPLNGGGFGVAEIAEVEQVRTEQPTPASPNNSHRPSIPATGMLSLPANNPRVTCWPAYPDTCNQQ